MDLSAYHAREMSLTDTHRLFVPSMLICLSILILMPPRHGISPSSNPNVIRSPYPPIADRRLPIPFWGSEQVATACHFLFAPDTLSAHGDTSCPLLLPLLSLVHPVLLDVYSHTSTHPSPHVSGWLYLAACLPACLLVPKPILLPATADRGKPWLR